MELKLGYFNSTPAVLCVEEALLLSEHTEWVRGTIRNFVQARFSGGDVVSINVDDAQPILELLQKQKNARYLGILSGAHNFLWQGAIFAVKGITLSTNAPEIFLHLLVKCYETDLPSPAA